MNTTLTNYASPRIPKIALVKIKTYLLLITLLLISLGLYFLVWTIEYATLTSSYYYLLMIMSGISFVIGKIAGKIPINKNVFDM